MNFPEELKYTKEHEWVKMDGNIATIGITDFAQKELGDIVYLDVSTLNQSVDANQIFGTVEAVKTVSDLFMPLAGKVIEINKELESHPDFVNSDPYGNGWMIKAEINADTDQSHLMSAADYKALIGM